MRVGIPAYRLPRNVLDADIEAIKKAGVEVKTGVRIESPDSLLAQGYDAVFIAVGAHRGARMGIDGEGSPGVVDALSFLREVNMGKSPDVAKRVAVVGGGNSAVDAARTALRLGAKDVTIVYRRTRAEMRAYPGEIEEALREGVHLEFLAAPRRIIAENGRLRMECLRTLPGKKDAGGLPLPVRGQRIYRGGRDGDRGRRPGAGDSPGVFPPPRREDHPGRPGRRDDGKGRGVCGRRLRHRTPDGHRGDRRREDRPPSRSTGTSGAAV